MRRQSRKSRNRLSLSSSKIKNVSGTEYRVVRGLGGLGYGALSGGTVGNFFYPGIGLIIGSVAGGFSGLLAGVDHHYTRAKRVKIKKFLDSDDAVNNVAVIVKRRNPYLTDSQAIAESKRRIAIVRSHIKRHESMNKAYIPKKV